ncbi:MAG: hypothetical protein ABF913_04885 [Oenococcus sp.]|uniref:hypothetical protein n=1 Tax=Oenococcus sp. TaxID=1979414 RepID=UPI0039EB562E
MSDLIRLANSIISDYKLLGEKQFMADYKRPDNRIHQELIDYWDLEARMNRNEPSWWNKTAVFADLFQILIQVPVI